MSLRRAKDTMEANKVVAATKRKPPNAGKGRPKGSRNKTTALLKDAILMAAKKAGGDCDDGLVNYLTAQAQENPGPFMSLLGKVLPMQVEGTGRDGSISIQIVKYDDSQDS